MVLRSHLLVRNAKAVVERERQIECSVEDKRVVQFEFAIERVRMPIDIPFTNGRHGGAEGGKDACQLALLTLGDRIVELRQRSLVRTHEAGSRRTVDVQAHDPGLRHELRRAEVAVCIAQKAMAMTWRTLSASPLFLAASSAPVVAAAGKNCEQATAIV